MLIAIAEFAEGFKNKFNCYRLEKNDIGKKELILWFPTKYFPSIKYFLKNWKFLDIYKTQSTKRNKSFYSINLLLFFLENF